MDYVVVFSVIELLYVDNDDTSERHYYSLKGIYLIYCNGREEHRRALYGNRETDRIVIWYVHVQHGTC